MHTSFLAADLNEAGLNLQHVFDLQQLPRSIYEALAPQAEERQLLLVGHGGRRLWSAVQAAQLDSEHPIDDYTRMTLHNWFRTHLPQHRYRIVYPGKGTVPLQALGQLAGWHHPSPFMVGVDAQWGSWFAYRAAILTDTQWVPTQVKPTTSACAVCRDRVCVRACPAQALEPVFSMKACASYRLSDRSACQTRCVAREKCPLGKVHRYEDAQIQHSYGRSLAMLRQYFS